VTTALFPGSFDPPTNGHVDVIARASALFDHLVVAVVTNPNKPGRFTPTERLALLTAACAELVTAAATAGRVLEFTVADGLLVDIARHAGAQVLVKGVRNATDVDGELTYAAMNRDLTGGGAGALDTVWLPSAPDYSFFSSSLVYEIAALGGDVAHYVPSVVRDALAERFGR
jgi:pantetheine-phosphate adenylyltransferase